MDTELVQLRSFYAEPGLLLIARLSGAPVGGVGLRPLGPFTAEIRRLFVKPDGRTSGLGRRLVTRLIDEARDRDVERLVLNTLPTMTHAIALYESFGFTRIDPSVADPTEGVLFYALDLGPRPPPHADHARGPR